MRLISAVGRCGNAHTNDDIVTRFIDGLLPETSFNASHYPKIQQRLSCLDAIDYSSAESNASRAMNLSYHAGAKPTMLMTNGESAHSSYSSDSDQFGRRAPCHSNSTDLIAHGHRPPVDASTTVPSSSEQSDSAALPFRNAGGQPEVLNGQVIPGLDPRQRSEWIDPQGILLTSAHESASNLILINRHKIKRRYIRGLRPSITKSATSHCQLWNNISNRVAIRTFSIIQKSCWDIRSGW